MGNDDGLTPGTASSNEESQYPRVYIVGPNMAQNQLMCSYLQEVLKVACSSHLDVPQNIALETSSDRQCICLVDCLKYEADSLEKRLSAHRVPQPDGVATILYNVDDGCRLAHLVRRQNVRGIFFRNDSKDLFLKGMQAILKGDLWLTRRMLSDCVLNHRDEPDDEVSGRPQTPLSRREKEILVQVAQGFSNQEIADTLNISLHTVKTHLYKIYKKIRVPNRLQAALWATTYLHV